MPPPLKVKFDSSTKAQSIGDIETVSGASSANVFVPQVWLITDCGSALGRDLAIETLLKGHYVAAACKEESISSLSEMLQPEFGDRVLVLEMDPKNKPLCQSCLARLLMRWERLDIVVNCSLKSIVGTIEEASEWHIREQFEALLYGPVNVITTVLPVLRKQKSGHILCVTGITGHMGTPSLGLLTSAAHALEGYAEALAFEVAPFNIKVTVVQPGLEAAVLANPIIFTSQQEHYKNTLSGTVRSLLSCQELSPELLAKNVAFAILSVAGVDNPPGRIVAGAEAIVQTKDKLRTVSEEMEDMLEVSFAADAEPLTEQQRRELSGE
ncbi:hypothetical protein POJ06DRAFT_127722 [Lipomyces tetrasporus]|uniref:Uncharacterized protein n=1 Tax=Lipomyces tetrasporus TaxID=54092 RepID=A0AAD7QPH5_9ASCO|nr:uncharacterized protein POJ06DRAFT_127722 [Lipomyces tetrasporus]KAJ8099094.1 hypothetical protein POJ06DRAFT_127722 [Lipomyces tetrasporus]